MTRKKQALIGGGIAVGLLVLYGLYDFFFYVHTDNAQVQANTLIMTARVSGYVSKVEAEEGKRVKAGAVLVEIDARDYQSRTQQSANELGSGSARLKDAESNYHRIDNLFKVGAVSAQQRDTALASFLDLSRRQKALEAQLDLSKSGLTDTVIRAPTDGTIAKSAAKIGMFASPGVPLVGFVSDDTRWVVANFKETDLRRLKVGQKVSMAIDAVPGKDFEGEIENFYPSTGAVFSLLPPDNATGNFTKVVQRVPTRIKFNHIEPSDIELLKAGLSAEVSVRIR